MQVTFEQDGPAFIATIEGRLDTMTAGDAETQLMAELESGQKALIIDLTATEYISSSGLRVLLKAGKHQQQAASGFALCAANTQVLEVLEISGFLTILTHFPTREEAITQLG